MRKQTKIAAIVSAAALLAIGASMTSFAAGWISLGDGDAAYEDADGYRVTNEWKRYTDGKYYYLGDDGLMARNQIVNYNEEYYYVDDSGAKVVDYWLELPNDDGITVDGKEVSTLYYYFQPDTGKAARANNGEELQVKNNIRRSNSDATKASFVFDTEGHMVTGWATVSIPKTGAKSEPAVYYLGEENEGYVTLGWNELEPNVIDDGAPYEKDTYWFNFGTNGKMLTGAKYIDWDGKKYHFYFMPEDGDYGPKGALVEEDWVIPASNSDAGRTYYLDGGYRASGWQKADWDGSETLHDTAEFYFENGVPFNLAKYTADDSSVSGRSGTVKKWNGTGWAEKPLKDVSARVIDGKTYLFNDVGEYQTGVYMVTANVPRKGGATELIAGNIYYFSNVSGTPKGSMVTKKDSVTYDDITCYYSFAKDGKAAKDAIKSGILYDTNGVRVNAEDSTWQVVKLADVDFGAEVFSDKKDADGEEIDLKTCYTEEDEKDEIRVIVNSSGRVKESGSVVIDGIRYYVKSQPSDSVLATNKYKPYSVKPGVSYVVVGYEIVE